MVRQALLLPLLPTVRMKDAVRVRLAHELDYRHNGVVRALVASRLGSVKQLDRDAFSIVQQQV